MEKTVEQIAKEINEKLANAASTADLDALKNEISALKGEGLVSKADFDKLDGDIQKMAETIAGLTQAAKNAPDATYKELVSQLEQAAKGVEEMNANKVKFAVTLKAVDTIATGNVTAGAGGNVVAMTQSLGILKPTAENRIFVEEIMSGTPVESKTITWIDEVPKDGDAGMTAEGALKSQSDVEYVEKTLNLQKVSHFMKVTTEMLRQPSFIVAAINNRLLSRLRLKKQQQLISGNGTAPQITGINAYAPAFAVGTYADTVENANVMDLIRVIIAQIAASGEEFSPNYAIVSHGTLARMDLAKGLDGHYVLPPFTTPEKRVISGVRVVGSNEYTDIQMLVGDFTKANFAYWGGVKVAAGLDGNDFTTNKVTILAEQYIGLFVSANELGAFRYVADVPAAVALLETP